MYYVNSLVGAAIFHLTNKAKQYEIRILRYLPEPAVLISSLRMHALFHSLGPSHCEKRPSNLLVSARVGSMYFGVLSNY